MGTMVLAGLILTSGVLSALAGGAGGLIEGMLQVTVGGLGLYAAYHRDLRILKAFVVVVALVLLLHVFLIVLVVALKPKMFMPANTAACDDAADPEHCREMVRGFRGAGTGQGMVLQLAISGVLNLWMLVIVDSLRQVVAAGGTGDEKLAPKQVAELVGPASERTALNNA